VLNQLTEFQRITGEFGASLASQKKGHLVAQTLLKAAPENPRWQRWMFLADGHLADAMLGTGDIEGGIAQWQVSIAGREKLTRADPNDERAHRNLANGYGPLAEALDALGRHEEALVWYQRENSLLRQQRAKHPQVKALIPRLDESDRDLALQLVLVGRTAEGLAVQRALDARRDLNAAPADLDDGKFALLRARVLLAADTRGVSVDEQRSAKTLAQKGLAVLRAESAKEPYNALLAREAALGAHSLALATAASDPAAACALVREAAAALEALSAAGKLPATVVAQRADAKRRAGACPVS
jgi:hypothetical protein